MEKYDVMEWQEYFEKNKGVVDPKTDFLETDSIILYPGRFYVLNYMAKTKDMFNTRPVILSLGVSEKDPESFLCIDLSVIPKKIRLIFIQMFFKMYYKDITTNIVKYPFVDDADKQTWMKDFSYENMSKFKPFLPIKNAIKKYKIKNTLKIFAVPFSNVYKIIGDYCDENYYKNGSVRDVQNEFIKKMQNRK